MDASASDGVSHRKAAALLGPEPSEECAPPDVCGGAVSVRSSPRDGLPNTVAPTYGDQRRGGTERARGGARGNKAPHQQRGGAGRGVAHTRGSPQQRGSGRGANGMVVGRGALHGQRGGSSERGISRRLAPVRTRGRGRGAGLLVARGGQERGRGRGTRGMRGGGTAVGGRKTVTEEERTILVTGDKKETENGGPEGGTLQNGCESGRERENCSETVSEKESVPQKRVLKATVLKPTADSEPDHVNGERKGPKVAQRSEKRILGQQLDDMLIHSCSTNAPDREAPPNGERCDDGLIGDSPRMLPPPMRVTSKLPVPTSPAPPPPTFERAGSAPQITRNTRLPPSGEGHPMSPPCRPPPRAMVRNATEEQLSASPIHLQVTQDVTRSYATSLSPPSCHSDSTRGGLSTVTGEDKSSSGTERTAFAAALEGGVPFSFWASRVQPAFLYETMAFVHEHALGVEGVFRISASTARIGELKTAQKEGNLTAELEKCTATNNEVLAVADFMNKHFQDSPLPLVPVHIFQEICQSVDVPEPEEVRDELRGLIYNMPEAALSVFCALLHIAYDASLHCETTKMHAGNLAICIGPNIMYDPTPTLDVVAVRKEAGLMTSSLAEYIKDFPQIFEDVRSGAWKEKGEPYAQRLARRVQVGMETPSEPPPEPQKVVKRKKSKGGVSGFLKKLKPYTSSAPSKPDTEFMRRRRESCVRDPTTDERQKHQMLQAMSVALVEMDPSEICLLSFHRVRDTLVEAEFLEADIDKHEKFLKEAILVLVTSLHSQE